MRIVPISDRMLCRSLSLPNYNLTSTRYSLIMTSSTGSKGIQERVSAILEKLEEKKVKYVTQEESELLVLYNNRKFGGVAYWDMSSGTTLRFLFQEKSILKIYEILGNSSKCLILYDWHPTLVNSESIPAKCIIRQNSSQSEDTDFESPSSLIDRIDTPLPTLMTQSTTLTLHFAPSYEIGISKKDLKPSSISTRFIFSFIKNLDVSSILACALSIKQYASTLDSSTSIHFLRVLALLILGWIRELGLERVSELYFQEIWRHKDVDRLTNPFALHYLSLLSTITDPTANQQSLFSQMTLKSFEDVAGVGEKIVRASEAIAPRVVLGRKRKRGKKPVPDLFGNESSELDDDDLDDVDLVEDGTVVDIVDTAETTVPSTPVDREYASLATMNAVWKALSESDKLEFIKSISNSGV